MTSEILIKILGDATGFDRAMSQTEQKAESGATGIKQKLGAIDFAGTGAALTASFTAPMVAGFATAIGSVNNFNAAMANVATLIPGQADRVNELAGAVRTLATETGKTTTDLAGGLYQVISAFGDTAETAKILEINARAAAAGLSTTEEAINLTSAVTKAYGDTSAAAVAQVSDLAFQTVTLGQTTFPELAASIGKVTPSAVAMGVSMEELFGFMATFTGVTGGAAEVSTQLNGVLTALLKPTDEMEAALGKIGFTSGKAAIEQLGLKGTMDALFTATGQNQTAFGALFGNVEALRIAFPATSTQAETLATKIGAMGQAAGLTDTAFKEQTQGINAGGFAMKQFDVAVEDVKIALGEALMPVITAAMPIMQGLVDAVKSGVEFFKNLPEPVQNAAFALGAVLAAAGPVLLAIGGILALPISGTMLAWAGAIAGATAAITLLWTESETFRGIIESLWNSITGISGEIITLTQNLAALSSGINTAFPGLVNFLGFLVDIVSTMIDWARKINDLIGPLAILENMLKMTNQNLKAFLGYQKDTEAALRQATKQVAQNAKEHEKLGKEVKDGARETSASEKVLKDLERTLRAYNTTSGTARTKTKEHKDEQRELERQLQATKREVEATKNELDKLATALTRQKEFNDLTASAEALNKTLIAQQAEMANVANIAIPDVVRGLVTAVPKVTAFGDEFKTVADSADTELGNVTNSLRGWNNDAAGEAAKFQQQFTDKIKSGFTSIMSGSISDLLNGEFSLAKLGNSFKQLGLDVVSLFTQPFINAITGPNGIIQAAIQPLTNRLTDLATQLAGLGGSVGSVPGVGSGGGGASGSGGGFGGGGADPVSMVTGIVTAISSVWGNFQNMEIETGIDKVEENTRYTKIWTGERSDSIMQTLWAIRDSLAYVPGRLLDIRDNTDHLRQLPQYLGLQNGASVVKWAMDIATGTAQVRDAVNRLAALGPGNINLSITIDGVTKTQTVTLNQQAAYNFT